ncbi:hypothetical protein HDU76_007507 [Blyttiomyces sp. JEL0837]|nr:hypothetical protein HDU76_007507 [Blyttiomyces sp. JEL0837]
MFALFNDDEDKARKNIADDDHHDDDDDDLFSTEPLKSREVPKYVPLPRQTEPTGTLLSEVSVTTAKIVLGFHPLTGTDFDYLAILYFAFNGIVEEYSKTRLTRKNNEQFIDGEMNCVRHGIYHHLEFAKWWQKHLGREDIGMAGKEHIEKAISAKLIMNNDLSFIAPGLYCIWYPDKPSEETLRKLLELYRHPNCRYQVGRACAVYNYPDLYASLDLDPEFHILSESLKLPQPNPITQEIERKRYELKGKMYCRMSDRFAGAEENRQWTNEDHRDFVWVYETMVEQYGYQEYGNRRRDDKEVNDEWPALCSGMMEFRFWRVDPLDTGIASDAVVRACLKFISERVKLGEGK